VWKHTDWVRERSNPKKKPHPCRGGYRMSLEAEEFACCHDHEQGECGDGDFAYEAYRERAKALLAHLAEIGAEADAGEGKKKRPAGKIGQGEVVILGEEACGGERRDQQESQNKFRKFLPEKGGFVTDGFGLAAARPVDGIGEDDETDQGIASGLGEDSEFGGSVGIQSAGSSGFGGIVDGESGPDAIGVIGEMQGVTDEREREKSDGTESEDGGDSEGGVFVVGIDGAFSGDDGADAADRGADREKRGEFGAKTEEAAEEGHERDSAEDFDADEEQADSAKLPDIAEKKARAEKNDASLEPEFVGSDTGLEDGGETEDIGDDQAKKDGPEDVFNVGKIQWWALV
jgi:AAA ATPase containing von Willebrand factor type A (vWA) domain